MAKTKTEESFEKQLWKAADKLRKNIDAAEYKHIVLGLIFLKYISDAFEELHSKLLAGEGEFAGADPEDKDEYKAENVFFVPEIARWTYLQNNAKLPTIGKIVDDAMDAIEKDNPSLKNVLPKVYARGNLDVSNLGGLIDLIGNIALGNAKARSADVLGHVFEYFLGEFALAEGKKGGQFYTPRSVVELLVEMLQPYKGRVFDPCCGSGGMFVQSEKFVQQHQGRVDDISIYGQESNQTTWRLAKMNLAIRGIDSTMVKWNNEGSFLNDVHKDLKADFVIANPPFNDSDWSGELLRQDGRWKYGTPPSGNANYAWIQHFLYHLNPRGMAGFILADTSLNTSLKNEASIRKNIVEADLVECIVALPSHLFSNTQITACIWILNRNKSNPNFINRKDQILFIDASRLGDLVKRKTKVLTHEDIEKIATVYNSWRKSDPKLKDINVKGLSKVVSKFQIRENNYILSPNRYVEPESYEISMDTDLSKESVKEYLSHYNSLFHNLVNQISESLSNNHIIKISDIRNMMNNSADLTEYLENFYRALIKDYFIDKNITDDLSSSTEGWRIRKFGELFDERKTRVKDIDFVPETYSVTNNGIRLRDDKFSHELSKSELNNKVAFMGDMVFGLSRQIPNLDVFREEYGSFSSAYHIYAPKDRRIGFLIGTLMRLRLMEQTDILKGGAREGRGLDKDKLLMKEFLVPNTDVLDIYWGREV